MTKPRIIGLGTHHKTGTVWMGNVFRKISRKLGISRVIVKRKERKDLSWLPDTGRCITISWSANFPEELHQRDDARFIHVIRDPRDILISGLYYHLRTTNERFLHIPRDAYDGKTYQEYLRDLPTLHDQFLFEMEEKHAQTLAELRSWDRSAENSFEWRYEDLIADTDCKLFLDGMRFVGLEGDDLAKAKRIFWRNSLFGGLTKPDATTADAATDTAGTLAGHVRSGKPAQWKTKLPPAIAERYAERFGDDLIELGYEADSNWLSRISYNVPTAQIVGAA